MHDLKSYQIDRKSRKISKSFHAVSMLIVCSTKRLSTNVISCEMLSLTPCLKYGLSMRSQKIVEPELKAFCYFNGLFSYFIFNIIIFTQIILKNKIMQMLTEQQTDKTRTHLANPTRKIAKNTTQLLKH